MRHDSRLTPATEGLEQMNEQLAELIARAGLIPDDLARDQLVPMIELTNWLNGVQPWSPQVLYRICRIVGYPVWDAADAIGALPESPSTWIEPRMRASSLLSVERYLSQRPILSAANSHEADTLIEMIVRDIRACLPSGYQVMSQIQERGRQYRQNYHTYLILSKPANAPQASSPEALIAARELRMAIDKKLSHFSVSMHWEPSRELKPAGHEDDDILIVESYFDNQASLPDMVISKNIPKALPLVILGIYYSGAKDIAVLLHRRFGLAAVDVSRYLAQLLRDTDAFRSDLALQRIVFQNLSSSDLARQLILTIDDYRALIEPAPKPVKLPGTAVLLKLSPPMLRYAAYHVTRSRLGPTARSADVVARMQATHDELWRGQQQLSDLARRQFGHNLDVVTIDRSDITAEPTGTYQDRVDEMFDAYCRAAAEIEGNIRRRRR